MTILGAANPYASLFAQLAFPQAQLMTAGSQIPAFALPMLMSGYEQVMGQSPLTPNAMIPPFLQMPSPAAMMNVMSPIAGAGYAQSQAASPYSQNGWMQNLFNPQLREAAVMERALRGDPFARTAFENAIGGRVMDFGSNGDGRFTVQRSAFNPYSQVLASGALSPLANQLGGLYQQMNNGVIGAPMVSPGAMGASPFLPLALNGFAGMANQLMGANPGGFDGFQGGVQGMPLFGTGQASWNPLAAPGKINNGNKAAEGAHSAQVGSILNDPSLSMEDKIMLALMVICQKMDDDIKRQSEYLNKLQNQQGKGGKKGAEKSIDIETKKLERMIQKRSQLFDTLSKVMERYDQSAKNVIQSMRG